MQRIIFHVDVNSAFLSWEAVYRLHHLGSSLDLRGIPSAVGGDIEKRHGIILAKSLPAKAYHVKTGETLAQAKEKCPSLQIVPPHYQLYSRCSRALMEILHEYTPEVEEYSIDEAFMDMTGTSRLFGEPVTLAHTIKSRIRNELGFTVNIGVGPNKLLAKMASDFQKPDCVHTLFLNEIPTKMWPLPVSDLFFVGRASFRKLHTLGINTIGDLAHTDVQLLRHHLKSHGEVIWNYANGLDQAKVESIVPANKGYGNSTTIAFDVKDEWTASHVLLSIAESLGMRLRQDDVKIQVISVGIKTFDLQYSSHQCVLTSPTNITSEIHSHALHLFREAWDYQTPIRHLGIHTSRVSEAEFCRQISLEDLMEGNCDHWEKLSLADQMTDQIRDRYGLDAIKRACFLESNKIDHISGGISREKMTVDYQKEKI